MPTLNEIVKRQDEWIRMARKIGADDFLAEDLVSEMYLKLTEIKNKEGSLQRLDYKGGINTMFIFVTLRNLFVDEYRRYKDVLVEMPIIENKTDDYQEGGSKWASVKLKLIYELQNIKHQHNYDYADHEFERLCDCVDEQMRDEHWYNRKLFLLYNSRKDLSLRKLAKATGINYYSIFETVKNVRNHIKERCESEYQAYQEARTAKE